MYLFKFSSNRPSVVTHLVEVLVEDFKVGLGDLLLLSVLSTLGTKVLRLSRVLNDNDVALVVLLDETGVSQSLDLDPHILGSFEGLPHPCHLLEHGFMLCQLGGDLGFLSLGV